MFHQLMRCIASHACIVVGRSAKKVCEFSSMVFMRKMRAVVMCKYVDILSCCKRASASIKVSMLQTDNNTNAETSLLQSIRTNTCFRNKVKFFLSNRMLVWPFRNAPVDVQVYNYLPVLMRDDCFCLQNVYLLPFYLFNKTTA